MIKANHVIAVALLLIVALLASLLTLLLVKSDPFANIEHARASGGESSGSEMLAVPVTVQQGQELLAVIGKTKVKNLADGGMQDEWSMVVYEFKNRTSLSIHSARRIQYDFIISNFNLPPEQSKPKEKGGNGTSPGDLANKHKKGEGADDPNAPPGGDKPK